MLSGRMMRFWYSASVAAHVMHKRMSKNDEASIVFHVCFSAGCCDMRNLSASLARPLTSLRKATIEEPIAPKADITMGENSVISRLVKQPPDDAMVAHALAAAR